MVQPKTLRHIAQSLPARYEEPAEQAADAQFLLQLAPATPDAVTMRSVDLWVGFVEVTSESSVTLRIAGPGFRPRLSFIASESEVIRLGTRRACSGIRGTAR
jgi:hypothetical protein